MFGRFPLSNQDSFLFYLVSVVRFVLSFSVSAFIVQFVCLTFVFCVSFLARFSQIVHPQFSVRYLFSGRVFVFAEFVHSALIVLISISVHVQT